MKNNSSTILWIAGLGFLFLSILVMFFPRWFTELSCFPLKISEETGHMGDTIGGIMGPFVALIGAVLTFLAFLVQYQANQKITNQFEHERFENKFYESLKVHKENVQEINIDGKYQGRKSFVWMYKEFRFIYQLCEFTYEEIKNNEEINGNNLSDFSYDKSQLAKLAYIIFFFGVGEISKKGIEYYIDNKNKDFLERIVSNLHALQKKYANKSRKEEWVKLKRDVNNKSIYLEVNFEPFDGHVSKLGHYFRHLYQLIKLATTDPVLNKKDSTEEKNNRYEYVKQIRVQLSNHEQAMIFYNSFFDAGKVWWGDESISKKTKKNGKKYPLSYFLDYKLIKNIPYNLTDGIGPDLREEFFTRLLSRGFNIDSPVGIQELKTFLQNDLFEWGFSDEYFYKYVKK